MQGEVGMGQGGGVGLKSLNPSPSRPVMRAPPPLPGGENPRGAKWRGAGQNCHSHLRQKCIKSTRH